MTTSRTKKFMYNSLSTALYQIVVMLVGFITPRIILQFYGSELNGLVSSINQFITYFSLIEAGIAGAATFSLYKPLAENDHEGVSAIVSATKKFYNQSGLLFVGMVVAMAASYPFFIKTEDLPVFAVAILVVVLGAKGFLEFFTLAKYRVILTADQKTFVISNASSIYILIQMIIIVVLAMLRINIVVVYTVAILALCTRSFLLRRYVRKNYPYINYKAKPNVHALDQRWDALFLQVLGAAQTGAPVLLATIFTSLTDVSIYAIYNMVFSGINGVLSIFVNGLSAGFGDVIARKEKKTLQHSIKDFEFAYYILITVVYTVTAVTLLPFIRLYTRGIHDADYMQPLLAVLFTVNGLLYNLKTPQGMLVISAGMFKETRYRSLAQALIIILGGAALAPAFGLVGILIASCLSNLYRCIDLLIFVPHRITKLPIRLTLKRQLLSIFLCIVLSLLVSLIPFDQQGFIYWIGQAIVVTIVVGALTVAVNYLLDKDQLNFIMTRFKKLLKTRR
ncbi:MAG: hypothetical protein IJN80_07775 [Clostridia bacterium]|nr:hypothetical protein [Clostridia bacterium]